MSWLTKGTKEDKEPKDEASPDIEVEVEEIEGLDVEDLADTEGRDSRWLTLIREQLPKVKEISKESNSSQKKKETPNMPKDSSKDLRGY